MSAGSVLAGLVGAGIQASRAPRLHEQEGARQGLHYMYRLIDLDVLGLDATALPEIVTAAERLGFTGLNVTYPCKQAALELMHRLSPDARAIGAVNTVIFRDGLRFGYNTDWSGFAASFRHELSDVARARVVQFGAGGAGGAVAHALLTLGVQQLALLDTDPARAADLAVALCARFGAGRAVATSSPSEAMAAADGVVNATPVGMTKFPGSVVPAGRLMPELWVADIVYFPLETQLLRDARACGCRVMSGGGMAVFQAADAFRLFSAAEPDAERMLRHFDQMTACA
jgi:quinate/shikimate dehydrogenase (NAD+)